MNPLAANSALIELPAVTGSQLQFELTVLATTTDPAVAPVIPGSTEPQVFAGSIDGILTVRCGSCHGGGNQNATGVYNLSSATIANRRIATLAYVIKTNPTGSSLIVTGKGGNNHGGGVRLTVASEITAMQNWITTTP